MTEGKAYPSTIIFVKEKQLNERLFTFLNKDQRKEELMVNRKLSQTKSFSHGVSGERGGNAQARRNEKTECLKQQEERIKNPQGHLPCSLPCWHTQKKNHIKEWSMDPRSQHKGRASS